LHKGKSSGGKKAKNLKEGKKERGGGAKAGALQLRLSVKIFSKKKEDSA